MPKASIETEKKVKEVEKKPKAVKKTAVTSNDEMANENAMLKAQLEKMQMQMEMLTQMVTGNKNIGQETKKNNKLIRFVNLENVDIVLKGTEVWQIKGRYEHIDLPEKEARAVALQMSNFLRKGSVYIKDKDFVEENDLDTYYSTLLSDEDLKTLLDKKASEVIEIYQNANDNQKEIITDMIVEERKKGKDIDNNILVKLGKLCGRNLVDPDED